MNAVAPYIVAKRAEKIARNISIGAATNANSVSAAIAGMDATQADASAAVLVPDLFNPTSVDPSYVTSSYISTTATGSSNLNFSGATDYYLVMSDSLNARVGMDGLIMSWAVHVVDKTKVTSLALVILRETANTNEYTVVGVGQEMAGANLTNGLYTYGLNTPILARADDLFGIIVKQAAGGNMLQIFLSTDASWKRIDDTGWTNPHSGETPKGRWTTPAEATFAAYAAGTTHVMDGGGLGYSCTRMHVNCVSPKVVIMGSSIAQGSPNTTYRQNGTSKVRLGAYIQVCHAALGNTWINLANNTGSDNASELLSDIAAATAWRPAYVHCQCWHNDVGDGRTLAQYLADISSINTAVRAVGARLIWDGPTPWETGSASFTTGLRNTMLSWIPSVRAHCVANNIIYNDVLGFIGSPTTAAFYLSNDQYDHLHLTSAGSYRLGIALAQRIRL